MLKLEPSRYIFEVSKSARDPAAYRKNEVEKLRRGEGVEEFHLLQLGPEFCSPPPPFYVWKPGDKIPGRWVKQVIAELEELDSLGQEPAGDLQASPVSASPSTNAASQSEEVSDVLVGQRVRAGGRKGGEIRQKHSPAEYLAMFDAVRNERPKATKTMIVHTVADRLGVTKRTAWKHLGNQ